MFPWPAVRTPTTMCRSAAFARVLPKPMEGSLKAKKGVEWRVWMGVIGGFIDGRGWISREVAISEFGGRDA